MKRRSLVYILIVILILSFAHIARTESKYLVNGRELTDMSVTELYDLEDAVVSAIGQVFSAEKSASKNQAGTYVINLKTHKFHEPQCYSSLQIGENRKFVFASPSSIIDQGYVPCKQCNPDNNLSSK